MKIPSAVARALLLLLKGDAVPSSQMRHSVVKQMLDDGVIQSKPLGPGKSAIVSGNPNALKEYVRNHFSIAELEEYIRVQTMDDITRADAVLVSGNSKLRSVRTFKGFPIQTIQEIKATLNNEPITISPLPGTCWFIQDYENLMPGEDVTIIGIENGENFQRIKEYGHLFAGLNPLFVCRYPQSRDLIRWLQVIPNNYVHFGDLDFEGIRIFLTEYRRHLGDRVRFYVPVETEALLQQYGNRELYINQRGAFGNEELDSELNSLIALFHKYRKVLEQEVFIDTWLQQKRTDY